MYLNDKKLARKSFKWYDWLLFSSKLLVQRVLGMKCILCLTFTTWLLWWVIRLKISIMMLHDNMTASTSMCERSLPKSTIFQMFNKHYRHLQTVKSSQGLVAINLQRNLFSYCSVMIFLYLSVHIFACYSEYRSSTIISI